MNQIFFSSFTMLFQHIFLSPYHTSITPHATAIFTYITIIIKKNSPSFFLLDTHNIHAIKIYMTIHAEHSTNTTILLFIKNKSENFCQNMQVTISADTDSYVTYQFALYQFQKLNKVVITKPLGNKATIDIIGKYLTKTESILECRTYQHHEHKNGKSSVVIEGVSPKKSSVDHRGFIFIAPHATGTNAKQSSRHITLVSNTSVYAEPILDVQNNTVSCSHASAIGTVNTEAIFYLTSRGISKKDALFFIVQSFAVLQPKETHENSFYECAKQIVRSALQEREK